MMPVAMRCLLVLRLPLLLLYPAHGFPNEAQGACGWAPTDGRPMGGRLWADAYGWAPYGRTPMGGRLWAGNRSGTAPHASPRRDSLRAAPDAGGDLARPAPGAVWHEGRGPVASPLGQAAQHLRDGIGRGNRRCPTQLVTS